MKTITAKNTLTTYLLASLLALAIAFAPFVGFAEDKEDNDNGRVRAEAKFEQKLEAKLNNPHSNSIFKRIASFLRNHDEDDEDEDAEVVVISDLKVRSVSPTRAALSWKTDARANSSVWYGISTGVNTSVDANLFLRARVLNHRVILRNLTAGTTYHVVVGSKGAEGDVAKSAEISFTTPALAIPTPDTTAPMLSNIGVSGVTSTAATVSWKTNEPSDSKVFYSKITPISLDASTTSSVGANAMVSNHSLNLVNLDANTVYYFKAQSADGSNNAQLSGQGAFMTAVGQ